MTRRKRVNSAKVNLLFSLVFHGIVIAVLVFFAAREGILGKKMRQFAVVLVPKEKKPEPPKEEPRPAPQVAQQQVQQPAEVKQVAAIAPSKLAPPPPSVAPAAAAAPPAAIGAAFDFSDGAKIVQTSSDPNVIYKGVVEYVLRSKWERPEGVDDTELNAEVELAIDAAGRITGYDWKHGSGDQRWDESVRRALMVTKTINRPPPKGFPNRVLVRFDVVPEAIPLSMN